MSGPVFFYGQSDVFTKIRKFEIESGLESYNISKIKEDKYGFLWIATQNGVDIFDGINFKKINSEGSENEKIGGTAVFDLFEDTIRNVMWIASSYGGLDGVDVTTHKVIFSIKKDFFGKDLKSLWVRCQTILNNLLWYGTSTGLNVYNLLNKKVEKLNFNLPISTSVESLNIAKIISLDDKRLIALCDGLGVLLIDSDKKRVQLLYTEKDLMSTQLNEKIKFWDILKFKNQVFIASNYGLRSLELSDNTVTLSKKIHNEWYSNEEIFCLLNFEDEYLYFANTKNLFQMIPGTKTIFKVIDDNQDVNWNTFIYSLLTDHHGNIWIGTQQGLALLLKKKSPFRSYYKSKNGVEKIEHSYSLYPYDSKRIIAGAEDGLYLINDSLINIEHLDNGSSFSLIFPIDQKSYIISSAEKLFIYDGKIKKSAFTQFPEFAILKNDLLSSACRINDSLLLLGSELQKGFYLWNLASHRIELFNNDTEKNMLKNNVINGFFKDKKNRVWVISEDRILLFDPISKSYEKIKLLNPTTNIPSSILMDACETQEAYWVLAYGTGLIELDKNLSLKKIYTTKDGLTNSGVYKIFGVGDSVLYITTNLGLSVFHVPTLTFKNYYHSDGLHSNVFEEGCGAMKDGKIYVGESLMR